MNNATAPVVLRQEDPGGGDDGRSSSRVAGTSSARTFGAKLRTLAVNLTALGSCEGFELTVAM